MRSLVAEGKGAKEIGRILESEVLNREIEQYESQAGENWQWQVISNLIDRSEKRRYRRFLAYCACYMIKHKSFERVRQLYSFS